MWHSRSKEWFTQKRRENKYRLIKGAIDCVVVDIKQVCLVEMFLVRLRPDGPASQWRLMLCRDRHGSANTRCGLAGSQCQSVAGWMEDKKSPLKGSRERVWASPLTWKPALRLSTWTSIAWIECAVRNCSGLLCLWPLACLQGLCICCAWQNWMIHKEQVL